MKNWYILYHHERRFASVMQSLDRLVRYEVEYYMPLKECFVPRKDRKCLRQAQPKPLFPCYMFVCFDPEVVHTTKISGINGAICFVRSGGFPYKVPGKVIEDMRTYPSELIHAGNDGFEFRNPPPTLLEKISDQYFDESGDKTRIINELKDENHRRQLLEMYEASEEGKFHKTMQVIYDEPDKHLRISVLMELLGLSDHDLELSA